MIATCVIPLGSDACALIFPPITAGAHTVSYTFTDGTETATFGGVLFAVTSSAPLVSIQWQDAAGTWIDGSGISLPFLASATTSGRCLITNTSNAPGTLAFIAFVTHPSGPATTVSITDTLDPGEQGAFTFYTGPASGVSSVSCSGPIFFPVASGANGGGNGGGVIPIAGTITASTLEVDPGGTVTIPVRVCCPR